VRSKKAQMSVYLDPEVMKALSAYAAQRERRLSLIERDTVTSIETLALFVRF